MAAVAKSITLSGDRELQQALDRIGEKAGPMIRRVWRKDSKKYLRPEIRKHVESRLGGRGKLAKSYQAVVEGSNLNDTAMIVYSRVPATVPHEMGRAAPITPKKGKYLAIPTEHARGFRRKAIKIKGIPGRANIRLTARMIIKANERRKRKGLPSLLFTKKYPGGDMVIYQKAPKGTLRSRHTKGLRGKQKEDIVFPMFRLKKVVTLRKRTDIYGVCKQYVSRLAKKTLNALEREFYKD